MAGWIILAIIFIIAVFLHISLHIFVSYNEKGLTITADYMGIKLYPRSKKEGKKGKKKKNSLVQKIKNKLKRKKKPVPDDDDYDYRDSDEETTEEPKKIDIPDKDITASIEKIEKKKQEEKTTSEKSEISEKDDNIIAEEETPEDDSGENTEKTSETENTSDSKDKSAEKLLGTIERIKNKYDSINQKYLRHIPYLWEKLKKTLKAVRIHNIEFEIDSGRYDASESAILYGHLNSAVFSLFGALAGIFTMQFKKAQINLKFNEEVFNIRTKFDIYLRPSAILWILICIGCYFVKEVLFKKFWNKIKAKKHIKAEN